MNILCDKHHQGLAYSLQLLFEKRLGFNVYFPIGMAWADEGYWKVHEPYNFDQGTAKQYLDLNQVYHPKDGTPPLNTVSGFNDGTYRIWDGVHDVYQKAITVDQFAHMPIDIIISSIPRHYETFETLRKKYHPEAKHINHMGNMFHEMHGLLQNGTVKNLLASTIEFPVPKNVNAVFYHQEFSLETFAYKPPTEFAVVRNFVNCLKDTSDAHLWYEYKEAMPDLLWKMHGIGGDDGVVNGAKNLADAMRASGMLWFVKPGGDGYGHVLYNAGAVGRPLITRRSHYVGKLGAELMIPDLTCIDLDSGGFNENVKKIYALTNPEKSQRMSDNMYERFKQVVHFDQDAEKVRGFMGGLL